jgi:hypothetical protein
MLHEAIINYHPEEKELGQTKLKPMPANILAMWRHLCEILSEQLLSTIPKLVSYRHGYLSSEIYRQILVCAIANRLLIQLRT